MSAPGEELRPTRCYLPDCGAEPCWAVTDLAGEGQLGACDLHLARLADRKLRRMDAATEDGQSRVIVSPLFEVEDVGDLAPLVAIGCEVYGLVARREIPQMVSALSGDELDALLRSCGGKGARR